MKNKLLTIFQSLAGKMWGRDEILTWCNSIAIRFSQLYNHSPDTEVEILLSLGWFLYVSIIMNHKSNHWNMGPSTPSTKGSLSTGYHDYETCFQHLFLSSQFAENSREYQRNQMSWMCPESTWKVATSRKLCFVLGI